MIIKDGLNRYIDNNGDVRQFIQQDGKLIYRVNGNDVTSVQLNDGDYASQSKSAKHLIDFQKHLDQVSLDVVPRNNL